MSLRPTKTPAIPAPTKDNLVDVARAVKGVLDVGQGQAGDELDRFVRVRDLSDDLFRLRVGVGSGGSGEPGPAGPVGPAGPPGTPPPVDLTPPPAPTGLTAETTFVSVILQWDSPPPAYIDNHAYTEVWRNTVDNLGSATLVGTSLTQFYLDAVGEPDAGYYYWIRFRSKANIAGPYNDTNGVYARTSADPAALLRLLTGQISSSQLTLDLARPILSIDSRLDEAASGLVTALSQIVAEGNGRAAAILEERTQRISAIEAEASLRTLLNAQVNNPVTGLPATRATLLSDYSTTAATNAAIAASTSTVNARLNDFGGSGATVESRFSAQADSVAGLSGQFAIKVDLNGFISGFGFASTAPVDGAPFSEFAVRADSFSIASPGIAGSEPSVPFIVRTTPTVINGEFVPAGVYLKDVLIENGAISNAKIGSIVANKITAGYTSSVDLEAGIFAGSEFYIGGTITYEFGNPSNPTQRTGIASVTNPSVALNASGATFQAEFFRILNDSVPYVPFEVVGGVVRIKVASIGDGTIGSAKIAQLIQSTNFNGSYTAPTGSTDPQIANVVLLLHADVSDPFFDDSPSANTFSTLSGVTSDPANGAFGGSLAGSSGVRQALYSSSTNFNLRSVFTLEFQIKWVSGQAGGFLMARSPISYMQVSGGSLSITGWSSGVASIPLTSGSVHRIVVRSNGTNTFFYRDGDLIETHSTTTSLAATPFGVFGVPTRSDLTGFDGNIDEVRWTQDVDRYAGAPPAQAAPWPGAASTPGGFTSYGTAGWAIAKSGEIVANSLFSRGAIAGGQFSTTDWSWPASGGGFSLGPQGLRLGREASGNYFEVTPSGVLRMPGLTVSGGNAVFSGELVANTVRTEMIGLEQVTIPRYVFSASGVALLTIAAPFGPATPVFIVASVACPRTGYGQFLRVNGSDVRSESVIGGSIPCLTYSATLAGGPNVIEVYTTDPTATNASIIAFISLR